jgi:hypothetical protein
MDTEKTAIGAGASSPAPDGSAQRKKVANACRAIVGLGSLVNIYIAPGPVSRTCAGVMVALIIVIYWMECREAQNAEHEPPRGRKP